ncbi:MAG: 3-deoxy-manno-octulosonate cytidylyltransferase [Pseudomonadota bacterium]
MSFNVVIPARFESSRLPGKVLADIGGKPMVMHAYERARRSGASEVIVATDDGRVIDALHRFGVESMMTASKHRSGTERLAEVCEKRGWRGDTVVVNVQADEPLIPPQLVAEVARNLESRPHFDVATLCEPVVSSTQLFDPNAVKVVMDHEGKALYFSRATMPWYRDAFAEGDREPKPLHFRHIGMYAYRAGFLLRYTQMAACELETSEKLEQLRVLYYGGLIHVAVTTIDPGPGIDTPDDLDDVRRRFAAGEGIE